MKPIDDNDTVFLSMNAPYCTDPRFDPNGTVVYIDVTDLPGWKGLTQEQFDSLKRHLEARGTPMGGGLVGEVEII